MCELKKNFIQNEKFNPSLWFRFLDDIFMIWKHSNEELKKSIDLLNHFHLTIKFTYTASGTHVSFLNVFVIIKNINNTISTNIIKMHITILRAEQKRQIPFIFR